MKKVGIWMLTGILAVVLTACAKPPVAEQDQARQAMEQALAAQAEAYAARTFNEAKALWDGAEAKMQEKSYKAAKEGYTAAKAAFEKAAGQVEEGKQAMLAESQALLGSVEQELSNMSEKAGKKVSTLKLEAKQAWQSDLQLIQTAIQNAKEKTISPREVKEKLEQARSRLSKWMEEFGKQ
ncbi:hypothetical protein JW933_04315 [candidate division FCPU426 bacterium]|nr:hypothetical protein [candidate division FCPU426 bacterium]